MTTTPENNAGESGGIHITGSVTGNVQSGANARATYVQHGSVTNAPTGLSPEAQQLLAAVETMREQLRERQDEVPDAAAQAAQAALDDAEDAVSEPDAEPDPGRIQRAIFTVTGALATVAGLATAVQALREAAAPWF